MEQRTNKGDLAIPIDSVPLTAFLNEKFRDLVNEGIVNPDLLWGEDTIKELSIMGVDSLKKLDDIIPKDFAEKARSFYLTSLQEIGEQSNFSSIVVDILIIYDADSYFQKAWNDRWQDIDLESVELICAYGVDFEKCRTKYNLDVL